MSGFEALAEGIKLKMVNQTLKDLWKMATTVLPLTAESFYSVSKRAPPLQRGMG